MSIRSFKAIKIFSELSKINFNHVCSTWIQDKGWQKKKKKRCSLYITFVAIAVMVLSLAHTVNLDYYKIGRNKTLVITKEL